ncbi:TIGR03085 family metal-binding protein [Tessaracoccus sp. Z1128]
MTFAQRQRAALVDLLRDLGPFAPTRCGGWQTQDLAAHLYVREHRLDALPGIAVPQLAGRTERIQTEELHRLGYPAVVDAVARPGWIMRPLDKLVNTSELFIHHEDVLRANDGGQELTAAEQQELWPVAKLLARKAQVAYGGRVLITRTDTAQQSALGQGNRPIHLSGLPSELVLLLSGRDADVAVGGEPDAIEAWRDAVSVL